MTRDGSFPKTGIVYYAFGQTRHVPQAGTVRAATGTPHVTHDELFQLFRQSGALLDGHFRLTSGLHSPGYLQCALVLQDPRTRAPSARRSPIASRPLGVTVVLSPALGGIVIGHEVARALGVRAIFAERQDGGLQLRRGFALDPSDRVLVVEDVVTTGGSTRETLDVARAAGATRSAPPPSSIAAAPPPISVCPSVRFYPSRCQPTSPTIVRSARRDCRWSSRDRGRRSNCTMPSGECKVLSGVGSAKWKVRVQKSDTWLSAAHLPLLTSHST